MQLTIVGGGGFRVPAMIDVLARSRSGQGAYASLDVDRVVLYDTDARRLDAMMAVLSSLDFPHSPAVRATTDIDEALPGADFVFSAMRVGGTCGRVLDEHCGLDNGLLGQETVGVGGYCYAFRSLGPALELARAAKRLCPGAWLINFTNPAGIITQAMRSVLGERVIGICDTPIGLVNRTLNALGVAEEERADVSFDYVGLNHLGWLRSLSVGGRDILPRLFADEAALGSMEESRAIGGTDVDRYARRPGGDLHGRGSRRRRAFRQARRRHRGRRLPEGGPRPHERARYEYSCAHDPQRR